MNSGANSSAGSLRKSSRSREASRFEQVVIVWFICILLLFWAVVKIFVFFVRTGLRHGLRSKQIR